MSRNGKIPITILIGQTGLGGAERQLYYFLRQRNRDLFDYHLIVLNARKPYTFDQAIREQGVRIWQLPRSCSGVPRRLRYIYCLLRQMRPRIIHSWSFYANPYAALAGWLAGVPVRLGSMRNEPLAQSTPQSNSVVRWLAYHAVSGIVVNTKLAADQLADMGYPREHVHLVFNGIELPESTAPLAPDPSLGVYGIQPGHRVIATVGNLRHNKNQLMFIDAMAQVLPKFPDVRCLIVGRPLPDEPGMQDQLESRILALGLSDKIRLTGVRDDVPQLMSQIHVFCLTSRSEGMPNVVLEAMAAARPVVATSVGDIPYVIRHGDNGFLVESEDSAGLAQMVTTLLEEPERATRIGLAGRATVEERFSCERMAWGMEQVYQQALRARCSGLVG